MNLVECTYKNCTKFHADTEKHRLLELHFSSVTHMSYKKFKGCLTRLIYGEKHKYYY